MIKSLTKHGNSWALVIDRPILELLNIDVETPLDITTDGQALIISPVRDEERRKKFQNALNSVNRKYRRTLKRLAK
ncbi:MAG: AbrB/MazE/SpoVT family DNA-binding domain-containing protein [Thermodesulfobacteriota bacterium]|nr:AbrB/MazE/SpoVT family DNA-binding domain-containing protein [Thermodesulfobacteriota bacterium]